MTGANHRGPSSLHTAFESPQAEETAASETLARLADRCTMSPSRTRGGIVFLATTLAMMHWACGGGVSEEAAESQAQSQSQPLPQPPDMLRHRAAPAVLSGRVVAAESGQPLADARVEILGDRDEERSDEEGMYQLSLPGRGEYYISVALSGYATTRVGIVTPPAEGDANTESLHMVRDVYLLEKSADLSVEVLTTIGDPAGSGIEVELSDWRFPAAAVAHRVDDFGVPQRIETDDEGRALLTDLPATEVLLTVLPHDFDRDGIPNTEATQHTVTLTEGELVSTVIVQNALFSPVEVIQSNFSSSSYSREPSNLHVDTPLFAVFSAPMRTEPGSTVAALASSRVPYEYDTVLLPLSTSWTSPVRLEMTPNFSAIEIGKEYSLEIQVVTASGEATVVRGYAKWEAPLVGGVTEACTEQIVDLDLEPTQRPPNYDSSVFLLGWQATSCRDGYRIYAKDDGDNAEWKQVGFESMNFETGRISTRVALPNDFDRYAGDSIQTPLAGSSVTFAVLPSGSAESTPGDGATTITVADVVPPEIAETSVRLTDFDPSGPQSVVVEIGFTEYLDRDTPIPWLHAQEAGGDVNFVLDPSTAVWLWDPGLHGGRFTFEIPSGADATGDELWMVASNVVDLSGNQAGELTGRQMRIEGALFDFEDSPQGWTSTGLLWEHGAPAGRSPSTCNGTAACFGTIMAGRVPTGLTGELISPPIRVPLVDALVRFQLYTSRHGNHRLTLLLRRDGHPDESIADFRDGEQRWEEGRSSLSEYAGERVRLVFSYFSGTWDHNNGVYIDNVSIETREGTTEDDPGQDRCAERVNNLALEPVQGPLDYDSSVFFLGWDAVSCRGGYRIYAKDDTHNTQWQQVASEPMDFDMGRITTRVELPADFDRYLSDNMHTPLAGSTVTFAVLPSASPRWLPLNDDVTLTVADVVAPDIVEASANLSGFDELGAHEAVVEIVFTEYVRGDEAAPQLEIEEAGGDPTFSLDPATATWRWDPGMRSGRFTLEIPQGADVTGDILWVTVPEVSDLSGNASSGLASPRTTIDAVRFDFDDSSQGWTTTGAAWEHGTPRSYPRCPDGGACWGTVLAGDVPIGVRGELVSPLVTIPQGNADVSFWLYAEVGGSQVGAMHVRRDGLPDELITTFGYGDWAEWTVPLTDYAGEQVRLVFEYDSGASSHYRGMYVDLVSIQGMTP